MLKFVHDNMFCWTKSDDLNFEKVRVWLEEILWDKKYGMDVYRCKGVLSVQNSNQLHTLQVILHISFNRWRGRSKGCSLGVLFYTQIAMTRLLLNMFSGEGKSQSTFSDRKQTKSLFYVKC